MKFLPFDSFALGGHGGGSDGGEHGKIEPTGGIKKKNVFSLWALREWAKLFPILKFETD